jgi:hypothetical protein
VYRYFRKIGGEALPAQGSAIAWGRLRARVRGLSLPWRFRSYLNAGADFYRECEAVWFGLPVLRRVDTYVNGMALSQWLGETQMGNDRLDQALALDLWAQALWTPSVLLTAPGLAWEPIDAVTARLLVPSEAGNEPFTLRFEPVTGLLRSVSALRYKDHQSAKVGWRLEPTGWRCFAGVLVPAACRLAWADEEAPWAHVNVDGLVANVDVSDRLPRRHLSADRVNGATAAKPDWWETVVPVRG